MKFKVIRRNQSPTPQPNTIYLKIDHWNDYSFVTMFEVYVYDESSTEHKLPNVKIGFVGQTAENSTYTKLSDEFTELPDTYFSLGTDVEYYKTLSRKFPLQWRTAFLTRMRDVVGDEKILAIAMPQRVFQDSHLRGVSISTIKTQFARVLDGDAPLTDFHFQFMLPDEETRGGIELDFEVKAESHPSTNIHALIGRNGVGKTTILRHMVLAIAGKLDRKAGFSTKPHMFRPSEPIGDGFFSNLVTISFSAFDPFDLPLANDQPSVGARYSYVGLIEHSDEQGIKLKTRAALHEEFVAALQFCLSEPQRKKRWIDSISILESDSNFAAMQLLDLLNYKSEDVASPARERIEKMSAGHAITVLILTQLVAKVEEKTLVLIDEPESHLHPPLLSALIRSLSELLVRQNGVAIIATHSPVVLQEITSSCVWKLYRMGRVFKNERPDIETFGENVGTLTREIFRLEVEKSGFHTLLKQAVDSGGTYDELIERFQGRLGLEARGILRAMIVNRDEHRLIQ